MLAYIRRVVSSMGCRITDEPSLEGVVPFYSGEVKIQSYAALEDEVYNECTGKSKRHWLNAKLGEDGSLSSQSVLDGVKVPENMIGEVAPITEEGFASVVATHEE